MNSHASIERGPRFVNAFGPFYRAPLQDAVNHAERLAELLAVGRIGTAVDDEWAAAWIVGRSSEIEQFVALTVEVWMQREVATERAAAMIQGYLATLHEGLAKHLRLHAPPCCVASVAATAPRLPVAAGRRRARMGTGEVPCVDDLLARIGGRGDTERDSGWSLP